MNRYELLEKMQHVLKTGDYKDLIIWSSQHKYKKFKITVETYKLKNYKVETKGLFKSSIEFKYYEV